jgi:hypothetical protein
MCRAAKAKLRKKKKRVNKQNAIRNERRTEREVEKGYSRTRELGREVKHPAENFEQRLSITTAKSQLHSC